MACVCTRDQWTGTEDQAGIYSTCQTSVGYEAVLLTGVQTVRHYVGMTHQYPSMGIWAVVLCLIMVAAAWQPTHFAAANTMDAWIR